MPEKISARIGKGETASAPVELEYDFGTNIKDAIAKFGEDVVFSHFKASAIIALQSRMRAAMADDVNAGKMPDAKKVAAALKDWKLGTKAPAQSKLEKASTFVGKMSADEKAELLKRLQAEAKKAA